MRRALKAIALRIAFSETTTVSGLMIASASPTLENNRWRPTNIDRSMLLKTGFLGVVRRRTMTCWRRTRFSSFKRCSRSKQANKRPPKQSAKVPHRKPGSPDSRSLASRIRFAVGTDVFPTPPLPVKNRYRGAVVRNSGMLIILVFFEGHKPSIIQALSPIHPNRAMACPEVPSQCPKASARCERP